MKNNSKERTKEMESNCPCRQKVRLFVVFLQSLYVCVLRCSILSRTSPPDVVMAISLLLYHHIPEVVLPSSTSHSSIEELP